MLYAADRTRETGERSERGPATRQRGTPATTPRTYAKAGTAQTKSSGGVLAGICPAGDGAGAHIHTDTQAPARFPRAGSQTNVNWEVSTLGASARAARGLFHSRYACPLFSHCGRNSGKRLTSLLSPIFPWWHFPNPMFSSFYHVCGDQFR